MDDAWTRRWDERYRQGRVCLREPPNQYLKEQLNKLPVGQILFPAEGEGRNAVYAATLDGPFQHLTSVLRENIKPYACLKPKELK